MTSKAQKIRQPEDDEEAYPYVLTNVIGTGSFATVYRGYHVVCHSYLHDSVCHLGAQCSSLSEKP